MTQTDTKYGLVFLFLDHSPQAFDGCLTHLGVSWAITDEQPIILCAQTTQCFHHSIKHLLTGIFKKLASSLNCLVSTKIFLVYILKKKNTSHSLFFFFYILKRLHKHIKLTCFTVLGFIHAKQTRLSFYTSKLHIIT